MPPWLWADTPRLFASNFWGVVYTEGWDRQVVTTGQAAKQTKQVINCQRIYPPLTQKRQDILAAAAPVVQQPPERYREPVAHAPNG